MSGSQDRLPSCDSHSVDSSAVHQIDPISFHLSMSAKNLVTIQPAATCVLEAAEAVLTPIPIPHFHESTVLIE